MTVKKNAQKKKRHKKPRKLYGQSVHRWPEKMLSKFPLFHISKHFRATSLLVSSMLMVYTPFIKVINSLHRYQQLLKTIVRCFEPHVCFPWHCFGLHSWTRRVPWLVDETEEGRYLLSIRGLHYIAVAGLLAELGCFKSYRSAKQMIKMAGSNPTESESAGKKRSLTPMSKQGRPVLRYCAWTSVIPMLRFNPDFKAWAKERRERPLHANPLNGREVVGAALNKLLRLSFALVKNKTLYVSPYSIQTPS